MTATFQMNRIEINISILQLNQQKEVLQNQVDNLQQHINFLVAEREQLRFNDTSLFDELFGG